MFRSVVIAVGALLLAAAPAAAEPALDWQGPYLVAPDSVSDIDCPTTSFCIVSDTDGDVITSSNPTGTASAWTAAQVTDSTPISISCSSPSLCVAVGAAGEIVTSTNPTGGKAAWTTTDIPGAGFLGAVDCAPGVCAALDNEGRILLSSNPTGGAGAWTIAEPIVTGNQFFLSSIDCPSSQLCVAVGAENRNLGSGLFVQENVVFTISDPVGPGRTTTKSYLGPRSFIRSISCPTTSFCIGVDANGESWTSTDPTGGAAAWSNHFIDSQEQLFDVSCPTTAFCAAVDDNDQALTSTDPLGGLEAWAATEIPSGLLNISCPSTTLCVAAGLNEVAVGVPPTPEQPQQQPAVEQPVPTPIYPASLFLPPSAIKVVGGKAKLLITCLGPYHCSGRAKLDVRAPKGQTGYRPIGSGYFSFKGRALITVKLNQRGRQLFKAKKQARARVNLSGRTSVGQPLSLWQTNILKRQG